MDATELLNYPQPSVVVKVLSSNPDYVKCPRCWHYHTIKMNHDCLCDKCCLAMIESWPDHESTPLIIETRRVQQEMFSNNTGG